MFKLFSASLKMLIRDKQALFWALAFPIIFATVFGLFDLDRGPTIDVAVVAEHPSAIATTLTDALRGVDQFNVEKFESLTHARSDLTRGKLDVVIDVPAGGGNIIALYNGSDPQRNLPALTTIRLVVDEANLKAAGVTSPPLQLKLQGVQARKIHYYDFLLPGLVAMGVMNFSITGMAIAVSRFREQRILKRILATPLRPVRFLAGQVMARLVLSVIQAALILLVGRVLFGGHVYGNVLWLFVLVIFANIIFLNIGFAVAGRAPNADAAQGIATAVAIPMMFLGGVFFPTDTLPKVMQTIVHWLPLTPLIEALRKISVDGLSITDTGSQVMLLLGWIVVSFALAAGNFRFADRSH